jgi:ubiquitin carboxyl-terminal hydrolase L3
VEEEARLLKSSAPTSVPGLYFTKQTVGNACGTVALIHIIANNRNAVEVAPAGIMDRFLSETDALTPEERARALETATDIQQSHQSSAVEGQTVRF